MGCLTADRKLSDGAHFLGTSVRARAVRKPATHRNLRNRVRALRGQCSRWRSVAAALQHATESSASELQALQRTLEQERRRWQQIRVSSPLTPTDYWDKFPKEDSTWRWWSAWCPCCKRPLDISAYGATEGEAEVLATVLATEREGKEQPAPSTSPAVPIQTEPRYAYAAALWGDGPGFVLGALVLGHALRRSGTQHDLVLMHTDDVPESSLKILSAIWSLKQVEYIDADSSLFSSKGHRFDGVFTKLHVLGLLGYAKVLMLDIDLAILQCPDELFDLPAPAALCRGLTGGTHGSRINGRRFFAGELLGPESEVYEWGQAGGINAGVMLLAPHAATYERALREVRAPLHPEHVPGNGPEQDYLSRLFAPWWTHIGVQFNYQLHHVFFALEAAVGLATSWAEGQEGQAEAGPLAAAAEEWLPSRLALPDEEVRIVHFSGELKTWDRDPFGEETDEEFARRMLKSNSEYSVRLWLEKGGDADEYAAHGVQLLEDGSIAPLRCSDPSVPQMVELGVAKALSAARKAATCWRADLESLAAAYPTIPPLHDLLERLREPSWPEGAAFARGAKVEIYWRKTGEWYEGTVVGAREDGLLSVTFDEPGFWGSGTRGIPAHCLRLRGAASSG